MPFIELYVLFSQQQAKATKVGIPQLQTGIGAVLCQPGIAQLEAETKSWIMRAQYILPEESLHKW